MYKIILISILSIISFNAKSQGNLQFNRVIVIDAPNIAASHTVPVGKVWKIEAATPGLNGTVNLSNTVLASSNTNNTPFWLPANYTFNISSSSTPSTPGKVSIIEFNVVP